MIKVVLVDDDSIIRQGLTTILESAAGIHVVAQLNDGTKVLEAARALQPDVVLMDIRMPHTDGLAATSALTSELSDAPAVIVLTTFGQDEYVRSALRAGAAGFLLKDSEPEELVRAIRTVHAGEAMLSPAVTRCLIESYTALPCPTETEQRALASLSRREREVLEAVADGLSNAEIAAVLTLSEPTVKTHVSRILAKLGAANRVRAALLAHNARLSRPPRVP
ncbi:response regulator [Streptomyces gamaensis]|uniref:Response regulator n=1 Tax=Streptomyces gamaensis TaxID=1763542 RepID=A0ABW0YZP5_9ACTN